jgi:Uma2 family endonuclease
MASQVLIERQKKQFSYKELLELERSGVLTHDRVELLEGDIIIMPPANPPHAIATGEARDTIGEALAGKAKVWMQNPLRLSESMDDKNLPVPDILVIKHRVYRDHPFPQDVYLLVEVSDSSLNDDRGRKLALYAKHGIGEYWIINLGAKRIEVYTDPTGEEYLSKRSYKLTEAFAIQAFPEINQAWLPETIWEVLES